MRNFAFICLLSLIITSCIERVESSYSTSYIVNETAYKIRYMCYKGTNGDSGAFVFSPYSKTKVMDEGGRGKSEGISYAYSLQVFDSIEVIFNDTFKVMHLNAIHPCNGGCIEFSSNRSIFNKDNWPYTLIKENRRRKTGEFIYTFTEQDYIYARDGL